jgi:hypothetical protein
MMDLIQQCIVLDAVSASANGVAMKIKSVGISILSQLVWLSCGCNPNSPKLGDSRSRFSKLSYKELAREFRNGRDSVDARVEALVRMYPKDGFEKDSYAVLHSVGDPKTGGIKWENAPLHELEKLLIKASSQNKDIIVRMNCKFEPYVWEGGFGHYDSNPIVDPIGKVNNIDIPEYEVVERISLPPSDLSGLEK